MRSSQGSSGFAWKLAKCYKYHLYSIEFTKDAIKALAAMPRNLRELLRTRLDALAADPAAAHNVKKLVGRPGYRLRMGDWRLIYTLDSGRLVVCVLHIGARGGIYE